MAWLHGNIYMLTLKVACVNRIHMDSCTFFLPSTLLTERAEREVGTTTQHTPERTSCLLAEQYRQHFIFAEGEKTTM